MPDEHNRIHTKIEPEDRHDGYQDLNRSN
jgi:hypothetical protein